MQTLSAWITTCDSELLPYYQEKLKQRADYIKQFPFALCMADFHENIEQYIEIMVPILGKPDGECNFEKCDQAELDLAAIEQLLKGMSKAHDVNRIAYVRQELMTTRPIYKKHSHKGTWTCRFLIKTGYDFGYNDFYFGSAEDREKFIDNCGADKKFETFSCQDYLASVT
jgi:hypothetical protein